MEVRPGFFIPFKGSYATLACKMPDNEELTPGVIGVSETAAPSDVPQFATAEYAHIPGTERCRICNNLISGEYFRVNNLMACSKCGIEAKEGQPTDSHTAFARALLIGFGAAILGLVIYATFTIVTGWSIGYISLAVGWLVAKGMMKGSNGIGGLRYQIAAVLLTYAAISLASVPIIISYAIKHQQQRAQQAPQQQSSSAAQDSPSASSSAPSEQSSQPQPARQINWGAMAGRLALFGLASPFLELRNPSGGILGLVILFVGLSIAFRMTAEKPLNVDGPYSVTG
jgi:hypothetical protein